MSRKNAATKVRAGKKEIDQEAMARFEIEHTDHHEGSGRRRLKKMCQVNESEELIDEHEEQVLEENYIEEGQPEYKQFGLNDDEDLRKEKIREEEAKKSKKMKGIQKLDMFVQEQAKLEAGKPKKEEKAPKIQKVAYSTEQIDRIKKEKKKNRKNSDDFLGSGLEDASEEDDNKIEAKRLASYELQYNNRIEDVEKLTKKIGLTASSVKSTDKTSQEMLKDLPINKLEFNKAQPNNTKDQAKTKIKLNISLSNVAIALTGQFEGYDRDDLSKVIKQLGGQAQSKISKRTHYLIQGSYVADKFKKRVKGSIDQTVESKEAKQRNIQIVKNADIDNFFMSKTGFNLHYHLNKNKIKPNATLTSFFTVSKPIEEKLVPIDQLKTMPERPKQSTKPVVQKMEIEEPTKHKEHPIINKSEPTAIIKSSNIGSQLWTQKHKPVHLEDVVGQSNQIKTLKQWLECWEDIQVRGNKRQVKQSKGWNAAGSINSKAALVSGDPGIGKTTTARLLAKQFNYSITEFNASDIRNKSGVSLMETGSFNLTTSKSLTKSLIIMDEVDGMSSGDRGGITAIINMIKNTKVPIICICNDRSSEKIRSLAGHCLDIKFQKPMKNLVIKRIKDIVEKEGGRAEDKALDQLVQTFQNDMRQILSYLEVIFRTVSNDITMKVLSHRNQHAKDASVMINHSDAARSLLNRDQFRRMKISERVDSFFIDSDMVPLMVHQNLLSSAKKTKMDGKEFHSLVQGVKGMVIGDMLDRTIRKEQEWGLMPSYGFMSTVYSAQKISESCGFMQFPSWLGKNSSQRKVRRLARQFKDFLLPVTLCSNWKAVKCQYGAMIIQQMVDYLKKDEVEQACQFLEAYNITPMILNEHLVSLQFNTNKSNPLSEIAPQTKAKLTRLFNKRHEDSKLKAKKAAKPKEDHMKFNEMLGQAEDMSMEQQQESKNEDEVELMMAKPKGKTVKGKAK